MSLPLVPSNPVLSPGEIRPLPESPPGDGTLVPWEIARAEMNWKQGEHVTIIGPTGQGKTTLALDLMSLRGYPLIIATKPRDSTMEHMKREGWHTIRKWPPHRNKTILWPKLVRPQDVHEQARAVRETLENVFVTGSYAVLIDELSYVLNALKCRTEIEQIWQQGRALDISLVTCALRPSHIPLLAYDQATHLFMFRDNDETNLKRMGGLGHWSRREIIGEVSQLKRHEFLLLNTRTGTMTRSKTERK